MGFNEKTHAFIAGRFYVELTERFGGRGRMAFIHATQYYAGQRGRRMAQRCIRDGEPLTPTNYRRYGEWENTPEMKAAGTHNVTEILAEQPDLVMKITVCPWHEQFRDMGLAETAGADYCTHIDKALVRGFNPDLTYEVECTLETSEYCLHRFRDNDSDGSAEIGRAGCVKDFAYHCAHIYRSFSEVAESVFGEEGKEASEAVLASFTEAYGREMARTLEENSRMNFNVCG